MHKHKTDASSLWLIDCQSSKFLKKKLASSALSEPQMRKSENVMLIGEGNQIALQCWAQLQLPARIGPPACAKLLGMAEHDIPILVGGGLLHPLGRPTPSAPKWFSAVQIVNLAANPEWLAKATQKLSVHWRIKRQRTAEYRNLGSPKESATGDARNVRRLLPG